MYTFKGDTLCIYITFNIFGIYKSKVKFSGSINIFESYVSKNECSSMCYRPETIINLFKKQTSCQRKFKFA